MGAADDIYAGYNKYTNINSCDYFDNGLLNQVWSTDSTSNTISTNQSISGTVTWTKDKDDYIDANTLYETLKRLEENFYKGDNNMATSTYNSNTTIGSTNPKTTPFNFDFGPLGSNSNVRMSPYGLAVCNSAGTWVAYDKINGCIVDTDFFNFPNGNKYMYKVPAPMNGIRVGDVILHNRKPMFVTSIKEEGTRLMVIDIQAGEEKVVMPARSPFGFNFVTKIVSMFDIGGFGLNMGASEANPFGNLLPMLMFMGDNKDFDPMMMMLMMGGQNPFAQLFNPIPTHVCNCGNKEENN